MRTTGLGLAAAQIVLTSSVALARDLPDRHLIEISPWAAPVARSWNSTPFSRYGLALAPAGVFAAAALAAWATPNAPPQSVVGWSGFYAGVNFGYSAGTRRLRREYAGPYGLVGADWERDRMAGADVGGQIGRDWELANRFVLGLAGDFSWSDVRADATSDTLAFRPAAPFVAPIVPTLPAVQPLQTDRATTRLTFMGGLRARLGYAVGADERLLPYASVGLAFGKIDHSRNSAAVILPGYVAGSDFARLSASGVRAGWSTGAGLEYKLWGDLSLKTEYRYVRLGGVSGDGGAAGGLWQREHVRDYGAHNVSTGLNYRFGGFGSALAAVGL